MFVAVKTTDDLQAFTFGELAGYRIKNGPAIMVHGMNWNEMMHTVKFNDDMELDTPPTTDVRVGVFEDVHRGGYVIFPHEPTLDLGGKPLIFTKRKRLKAK